MKTKKFKIKLADKELEVEINDLTENANGACFSRMGETTLLSTVLSSDKEKNLGFFPLTVEYQEKYYAAGKILGSRFIRRESRPTEEAVLTSRVIDRSVRPLFPKKFKNEVQLINTCLSWDKENDPDVPALIGSSVALTISDIPWNGPIGAVRVGYVDEKFILKPTYEEREKSAFDLLLTGVKEENEILINMIEADAHETPEKILLEAIDFAVPYLKELIEFQEEIKKEFGKEKMRIKEEPRVADFETEIKKFLAEKIKLNDMKQTSAELEQFVKEKYPREEEKINYAKSILEEEAELLLTNNILEKDQRPDGRKLEEIRPIEIKVGVLPRTHGSALFIRGGTKALSILTLGAPGDMKILEGMEIISKKRFMHQYNFPPFSSGEVAPLRAPSRREIGHGMLAERALLHLVPPFDEFPYTIRIVTEILSSNGSTSMASTCAACLALMDAGVPIKSPVAGISLGLVKKDEKYKILTDIQGPEDHYGDMDFKVTGTENGVTAIQLDVKIEGLTKDMIKESLERGRKARNEILEKMKKTMAEPRKELSSYAPRVLTLKIDPEKIRLVIGPGGKVIQEIIAECGVVIDVEETGKIYITAEQEDNAKKAYEWINGLTREAKIGETFQGKVNKILPFGAFVEILPGQDGMIHISNLSKKRVKKVEDVVNVGDMVSVKVINVDKLGRIDLSLNKVYKKDEQQHKQ